MAGERQVIRTPPANDAYRDNWERVFAKEEPRVYPCQRCGVMRTKAEGGTVFTVCDDCWNRDLPK